MKLVKDKKIARFPKANPSVRNILKDALSRCGNTRVKTCVLIVKESNGEIYVSHSNGPALEKLGLLDVAKDHILRIMKE